MSSVTHSDKPNPQLSNRGRRLPSGGAPLTVKEGHPSSRLWRPSAPGPSTTSSKNDEAIDATRLTQSTWQSEGAGAGTGSRCGKARGAHLFFTPPPRWPFASAPPQPQGRTRGDPQLQGSKVSEHAVAFLTMVRVCTNLDPFCEADYARSSSRQEVANMGVQRDARAMLFN